MDFLGDDSDDEEQGEREEREGEEGREGEINKLKLKYITEICQQSFKLIMNYRQHLILGNEILLIINNNINNKYNIQVY